jgi:hypothetical protein
MIWVVVGKDNMVQRCHLLWLYIRIGLLILVTYIEPLVLNNAIVDSATAFIFLAVKTTNRDYQRFMSASLCLEIL